MNKEANFKIALFPGDIPFYLNNEWAITTIRCNRMVHKFIKYFIDLYGKKHLVVNTKPIQNESNANKQTWGERERDKIYTKRIA